MKLRKELGSEAVRDLILEAQARAATVPDKTVRDPWPDDRLLAIGTAETRMEREKQEK
jgi:hypothetical protein